MTRAKYDLIFVVLCYKNTKDIIEFIQSTKSLKDNYKIIVVNSYYDESTKEAIEEIAKQNKCDFINIPNKGYGYGNNRGIEYARLKYEFDYLIVCNADIELYDFELKNFNKYGNAIIGPRILNLKGKNQNPMHFKRSRIGEYVKYISFKRHIMGLAYIAIGIEKIQKIFLNVIENAKKSKDTVIFAAHGSCIIFSKYSLDVLSLPFDENIFLMCEENDLAMIAKKNNVEIVYCPGIIVKHKEDGSIGIANLNMNRVLGKSYMYYYEKWNRSKQNE